MTRRFDAKHRKTQGQRIHPPAAAPELSPEQQPPLFCLQHCRCKGYSLPDCERDERAAFASTLDRLSQLSWNQIRNAPRHGSGSEKIARGSIRVAIPPSVREDASLLALRFDGMKPMVGYKDGRVFHILWLDRDFTLYDHG